jgi:hypothetical protein
VRYFLPALRRQRQEKGEDEAPKDPGAQAAFIDMLCGGKKYEGEMWWIEHLRQSEEKAKAKAKQGAG